MSSVDEVEDYISELVGEDNKRKEQGKLFITRLRQQWHKEEGTPVTPPTTSTSGAVGRKLAPPPGLERKPQNKFTVGGSVLSQSQTLWMVKLSG